MKYILFLILTLFPMYSYSIEYTDIYSQGIIKRYVHIDRTNGVKIIPIKFTVNSFQQLFNFDNRDIQCTIGKHPPIDGKNVPNVIEDDKCKTTLMKSGDKVKVGFSIEPLRLKKFKMFIPPFTESIDTMKFFLAQNLAFTVVMGYNYDVSTLPECWNNIDYKSLCVSNTKMFNTNQNEYNKIFKDNSYIVLEKYQSEAVEPKFFNIKKYTLPNGGYLYFKVLRNTFPGKVVSKFETVMTIDAIPFVNWFRKQNNIIPTIPVSKSAPVIVNKPKPVHKPKPKQSGNINKPESKVDSSGIFGGAHRDTTNTGNISGSILDKINPKLSNNKNNNNKDISPDSKEDTGDEKDDKKQDKDRSILGIIINVIVSIFNAILSIFGGE